MVAMKRFIIITLTAIILASCSKDADTEVIAPNDNTEYIYASFEDEHTRVELNGYKQSVWTKDDMIVRFGNNIHDVWKFEGETGDRSGKFSIYGQFGSYLNFDFEDKVYALYSYDNYLGCGYFSTGEPAIFFNVKATQTYKPNTYDPTSNIMIGTSDDGSNFKFRNAMGYLRISLTGNKEVDHIALMGNNNEVLNGARYIKHDDIDIQEWHSGYDNLTNMTTIYCDNAVQLSDIPTNFYFTIAPTNFTKGISVVVYFTDGTQYPISTSKSIVIERNTIQPMANINTGKEVEWQVITFKHYGEFFYTPYLFDMYGSLATIGYIDYGDDTQTQIKDSPTYYVYDYIDTEHEITVKTQNVTQLYLSNCTGINEIDLTNF